MSLYTKRIFKCKDSNIFQLNTFFVILFSHLQKIIQTIIKTCQQNKLSMSCCLSMPITGLPSGV